MVPVALLLVLVLVGVIAYRRRRQEQGTAPGSAGSVAVLPFVNMSSDKSEEYFADGLTDALINKLAKIPGVKVVGRSSAFQFKGKHEDLREVGRQLGVANVLEGTVRKEGDRLRITAELVKVGDGFQVWSDTYERQITDLFAVQDEIASSATAVLQNKLLGAGASPRPTDLRNLNPAAYQAYLEAQ